ncbi:ABC transporter substrate-binding protein [Terribacillus sp. 179-K 1B1 HS]|uniref:ABC transporter substrate-binding protein n=1 Tax=Terribacillus sp. 179-K 1B1 HS TaxID=3142388 RepID=UPI00399FC3EF
MDISYYLLRAHLYGKEQNQQVSCTLLEIEAIWQCTRRHVIRKLKKLEELGKLRYQPGRGRGHSSVLTFLTDFREEVENCLSHCIREDKPTILFQVLQLPIPRHWYAHMTELEQLFGYQQQEGQDTLRTVFNRQITTLDPCKSSVTFESHLIEQLSDTLVIYEQETDSVHPHLAHHWKTNEDCTEWIFYLRKGVLFHHLREMTAADIAYTVERFTVGTPFHWLVRDISQSEVMDRYIIRFKLAKPNPFFLRYIASAHMAILPHDVPFDENEWVATGPYQLKERTDQRIVLEVFPSYFHMRPFLDRIEMWRIKPGEKEVNYSLPDQKGPTQSHYEIEQGFRFLAFNFHSDSIIQDRYFREAMYHLVDTERIFTELNLEQQFGKLKHASSYFPENSFPPRKSVEEMQRALAKSAYQGEALKVGVLRHKSAFVQAEWLVEEAAKYNIMLELCEYNLDSIYNNEEMLGFDMAFMGEVANSDRELSFIGAFKNEALLFRTYFGPHLKEIDAQLDRYQQGQTKDERSSIAEKIEAYLHMERLIIFQNHPIKERTHTSFLQDLELTGFGHPNFRKLWIDKLA